MLKDLEKMLMKKDKTDKLSDKAKQAKMEVLKELFDMTQSLMGSKVKDGMDEMRKVTVMAPDKESLKEGLEKAQEMAENPELDKMMDKMEQSEESEEKKDSPEEEMIEEISEKMASKDDEDEEESPFNYKKSIR